MIDGAVYSGSSRGANIVARAQSANRWERFHITFLNLSCCYFDLVN